MKKKYKAVLTVGVVCIALVLSGCQSYAGSAGLGAALGAGTGALVAHDSKEGAIAGAIIGGLAGLVAHDIKAKKQRDAQATAQQYGYVPAQGEVLSLETSSALPSVVLPGNMVEGSIQYALLGSGNGGIDVVETRQLMRGDQLVGESTKTVHRTDGTWASTQQFKLPNNAPAGQYRILQTVQSAKSRITASSSFTVQ